MRLALLVYVLAALVFVALADTGHLAILLWKIDTFMPYGDQLVHFVVVGAFAALAVRALPRRTVRGFGAELALGTAIAVTLGGAEELLQLATPHRVFSGLDLVANTLGALTFGEIAHRTRPNRKDD